MSDEQIAKLQAVTNGGFDGKQEIKLLTDIRNIVQDILLHAKRRDGDGRPLLYIKGRRRDQFLEMVRLMGGNPKPTRAAAIRMAIRKYPGTKNDPGYDFRSLKRYAESKPEYFA